MAITFPSSPSPGDIFTSNGKSWQYVNGKWESYGETVAPDVFAVDAANDVVNVYGSLSAGASASVGTDLEVSGDLTVDTSTLHVDSTNNRVGIGTTTPSSELHIQKGSGSGTSFSVQHDLVVDSDADAGIAIYTSNTGRGYFRFGDTDSNASGGMDYDHGTDDLNFRTSGSTAMTIDSSGNVGVGTTSPSTILDINKSGDPVVRVTGTDADDTATLQLLEATTDPATFGLEIKYDGNVNITKIGHYNASTTVRTDIQITRAGGYVTMPNQPAFDVTKSAGLTSGNNLIYNTVNLNNGSHYSTANGRFTAPVTGIYFFYWTNLGLNSSGDVHRYYLRVNGSNTNKQLRLDQTTVGAAYQQATQNGILSLSAGDYVNVYYTSDSGSNSYGNNAYTRFGGYLLG